MFVCVCVWGGGGRGACGVCVFVRVLKYLQDEVITYTLLRALLCICFYIYVIGL